MDTTILILGLLCCTIGIIGSFLPALPGAPLSWIGLLLLFLTKTVPNNYYILAITLIITVLITLADYYIPAKGTQKFGGTKYGIWGTNIGLIIGLFFPPIGFIVGLFLGAFVGELIHNSADKKGALNAAIGAFLGFIVSTFMKLVVTISFLFLYLYIVYTYF